MQTRTLPTKLLLTLIRRGLFHSYFRTELENPIILDTICSKTATSYKITISLFREFNSPGTIIKMLETEIFSDLDGILGCNILKL